MDLGRGSTEEVAGQVVQALAFVYKQNHVVYVHFLEMGYFHIESPSERHPEMHGLWGLQAYMFMLLVCTSGFPVLE